LIVKIKLIYKIVEGGVYAIGDNTYGELGLDNIPLAETFTRVTFSFDGAIKKISTGARHSLVLLDNGDLYAFGDNSEGQCTGLNTKYNFPIKIDIEVREKIIDIYSGYNHNLLVMSK
jgi:alpha-tubulin suppressor-like RCC1 family protein